MPILYKTKKISTGKGYVLRGLKSSEEDFFSFGEVYFSVLSKDEIRAWKRHKEMICNLLVPEGNVKIVLGTSQSNLEEVFIGEKNYFRLTIPNGFWFGFKGLDKKNIIANIASIEHHPDESENKPLESFNYKW